MLRRPPFDEAGRQRLERPEEGSPDLAPQAENVNESRLRERVGARLGQSRQPALVPDQRRPLRLAAVVEPVGEDEAVNVVVRLRADGAEESLAFAHRPPDYIEAHSSPNVSATAAFVTRCL